MNMATKKDIFQEHLSLWLKTKRDRTQRGEITKHIVFVTNMHPKSAPRKFKTLQMRERARQDRRGRPTQYGPDVTAALKTVWDAADEVCGELLHPVIREYVAILKRDEMWTHQNDTTEKLLRMSERTVKRRVSVFMKIRRSKGGASTTSPSLLQHIIPIFKGPWRDLPPGVGQLDTVAHCGDTIAGSYVFTVNCTDVATYWVLPRAQWNKGQEATVTSLKTIKTRLPFPLTMLHPDSGGEFINWVAKRWCEANDINLTRSEPYKKNDNMYVEERNGHVVRRYLGYQRLDCPGVIPLMNELYDVLALYLNHFRAVRRMIAKERVGARYVRRYERKAQTPYQRVLAHTKIPADVKTRLREEHEQLNPLLLKRQIDTLKTKIYQTQKRHETGKDVCKSR